ncbi:type II toxin-antitoxin system PemK/MazF family toxin [Actinomycetaceae bacterium TAE3-ERU4]|nr:type II toxin-antitoxin system PemK/MazF family toxin [Actinomycetaceae bacterium TAE3-ERU4]
MSFLDSLLRVVIGVIQDMTKSGHPKSRSSSRTYPHEASKKHHSSVNSVREWDVHSLGLPAFQYAPHADGIADPGEVVWTWIPYEEDPTQGKDRPVIVLARVGDDLVISQLTSKDHDLDAAQEAHWGRYWFDIGTGNWDSQRRPSEARVDRLLVIPASKVRREGGRLNESMFNSFCNHLKKFHRA